MSTICLQRDTSAVTQLKEDRPQPGVVRRGLESLAEFAGNTAGDIAMMFGIMAFAMFGLVGAAVDLGRWLNARDQTLSALDAAVLAIGRAVQTNSISSASDIQALGAAYYNQATANRIPVIGENVTFKLIPDPKGQAIVGYTSAQVKTPIMSLLGVATLPLLTKGNDSSNPTGGGAEVSKAILAVGGQTGTNLEITVMLDTSGSMDEYTSSGNKKYIDMRAAASDLVNIVVWDDQSEYTSKLGIVPFSGDVRVPNSILTQVTAPNPPASKNLGTNNHPRMYYPTPCVAERTGADKYTDAAPVAGNYVLLEYNDTSNNGVGDCEQAKTTDEVMPLTSNKANLLAKIATLTPEGYTAGQIGTAWAWYLLSPNWASVLPVGSKPVAYTAAKNKKIAILMTDGDYNSEHDANGVKVGSPGAGSNVNGASSPTQAVSVCNGMKAQGIEVYTIGFNVTGNTTAINTLSACATDAAHFYNAADGEQIKQAFRAIALKISSLYLGH